MEAEQVKNRIKRDEWWCNAAVSRCLTNTIDPCCGSFWDSQSNACNACRISCSNRCF